MNMQSRLSLEDEILESLGSLKRDSGRPLYQQLGEILRSRLGDGDWDTQKPLPSEARLSEVTGLSHSTVRQALNLLVQEGLLIRERGRGTFVRPATGSASMTHQIVKHHRVALVMPWDGHSFFASMFPSIEDYAHQAGFRTLLVNNWNNPDTELERIREAVDHGIDGLIWMCADNGPKPTAVRYAREKVPAIVMIDRMFPALRGQISLVDADNKGGMMQLVHHLISQGRQRIAFAGSQRNFSSSQSREKGYQLALKQAGIKASDDWIFGTRQVGLEGGRILAKKILQSGQPFDAICCSSDAVAIGMIHVLQDHGLRIPEDIAVTGFDDDPLCLAVKPALTTVRMDLHAIATEAVRLLFDQLNRRSQHVVSVSHISTPVELKIRQSG